MKPSKIGMGSIPLYVEGIVLKYVNHPVTTKLLVDFSSGGRAIVPLSCIARLE
ncbi:MAG: hypothetical protein PHC34_00130 [Candidatus Gastranaerophilales bacterium]|nr:hypothetical protein [Candidatus Gastranaerophilales bacterium]